MRNNKTTKVPMLVRENMVGRRFTEGRITE